MTIYVELYGRLRDEGLPSPVELDVPEGATAGAALEALRLKLGANKIEGCALATESAVLAAGDPLPREGRLAALPPVCGG